MKSKINKLVKEAVRVEEESRIKQRKIYLWNEKSWS